MPLTAKVVVDAVVKHKEAQTVRVLTEANLPSATTKATHETEVTA
jgi:hypothetical protein